jgi:hypothetical protein
MSGLWNLNLIRFFEFYLALAFVVSTGLRFRQYEVIIRLVRAVPGRWPRLLKLVKGHHAIFLTWATVLPTVLALGLYLINTVASRLLWPEAALTAGMLGDLKLGASLIVLVGAAMLGVDLYATFSVGEIDRVVMERYFDEAEYWLRSWVAPVVQVFTFGYVNPRRMVAVEVRKALVEASRLLNTTLWWVIAQVSLRMAFGLVLWLTWAWS